MTDPQTLRELLRAAEVAECSDPYCCDNEKPQTECVRCRVLRVLGPLLAASPAPTPTQEPRQPFDHYFNAGRCSGHDQFNGRYCRDAAEPRRWCIHCAGFWLQQQVAPAAPPQAWTREDK